MLLIKAFLALWDSAVSVTGAHPAQTYPYDRIVLSLLSRDTKSYELDAAYF